MSPAGYWPQLQAAVEAGADSVYFGLKHFTARAKVGFGVGELDEVFRTLHRRGVRGFVTFNTLVFDHELKEAAKAVGRLAEAGADAIIVQDVGILRLAREIAPDLEIHASTQMSVTDAAGANLAREMGVQRVTLARELSLQEIAALRRETEVELEVFVHGALCVAYSGQCFSSEAWGGRSANRGQCAQACRLPYEMFVDGVLRPLGDARYLLSPGDLYALHQVPELAEIGVHALKIEGRYKEADYVAATTRAYRKAVDDAWAGRALTVTESEELQLEQIYSRGLGAYFIRGTDHQAVVRGRAPRHRGVLLGKVLRVERDAVVVAPGSAHLISPLKPGDGVVFDAADWRSPEEAEEGGRVYEVESCGKDLRLRFGRSALQFERIRAGDLLWRTDDPNLAKELKPYLEASAPVRRQSVEVEVRARVGELLRTRWRLAGRAGAEVEVSSAEPVVAAQNRALDERLLAEQLGRLGGTAYELGALRLDGEEPVFVPASTLNQMRRAAVERLSEWQASSVRHTVRAVEEACAPLLESAPAAVGPGAPAIHLLVREAGQLDAALAAGPDSVTLDYLDLYGLKPSVERVRSAGIAVRVAAPRVLKPGEERVLDFLLRLECPLLVRPAGMLKALQGRTQAELTGDFSLNAANALTARLLLQEGLERITPTHDLNGEQVSELARGAGAERIEAIVYQHLPVFHTEHCVFCRFLSTGTTFRDCGRPCETHRLELGDPSGRRHPVMADVGCRNTVFGAEAQEASRHLDAWRKAGIRHFRIEFVHESGEEVERITEAFRQYFRGAWSAAELRERLRTLAPQGATQGSLFVPPDFPQLPILQ